MPNQRASLFLKNALALQIQKPAFAPEILSIENFVEELSTLKKVSPVDLTFEFYSAYQAVSDEKHRDSFDQFLGWAKIILSGSIGKPITLKGLGTTKGARAAIEAAGGRVED